MRIQRRGAAVLAAVAVLVIGVVQDRLMPASVTLGGIEYDVPVGGALYAVLAYLLVVVVAPRLGRPVAAVVSLAYCVLVELAQLTVVPAAIVQVFPPARFVLGTSFDLGDLPAYAVGVAIALIVDLVVSRRRRQRRPGRSA